MMLYEGPRNDLRGVIAGFLAGYGFASFVCFVGLTIAWASVAPHAPDPAHGLIYPHNEHGAITYFSAFQVTSCALLLVAWPVFFLAALSICRDPRALSPKGLVLGGACALLFTFFAGAALVAGLNGLGVIVPL